MRACRRLVGWFGGRNGAFESNAAGSGWRHRGGASYLDVSRHRDVSLGSGLGDLRDRHGERGGRACTGMEL